VKKVAIMLLPFMIGVFTYVLKVFVFGKTEIGKPARASTKFENGLRNGKR